MGMRIGGGGGGWANYQATSTINSHQQRQQGVKNLFTALQSGEVTAAQTAFTALQNQGLPANSPLNTIGQALQTGDLASAQKAAQGIAASRAQHGHGGGVRGNDGDADDKTAQSSTSAAPTTVATSTAGVAPKDASAAFSAFMQTLESSLEQQNPSATSTASMSETPAVSTPSTQAVLWSQGSGFNQTTSAATLKADLDSLIQQITGNAPGDTATAISTSTTPAVQSTASALQSNFSNLIGSLGGQASNASVMDFLKTLDASLSGSGGSLNISA